MQLTHGLQCTFDLLMVFPSRHSWGDWSLLALVVTLLFNDG